MYILRFEVKQHVSALYGHHPRRNLYSVNFRGKKPDGSAQCATDLQHLYRIYSIPTHNKHQWLLLQFIVLLMMDAKGVRNMYSIPAVFNKHNTARVASCWFIKYYNFIYLLSLKFKKKKYFLLVARQEFCVVR